MIKTKLKITDMSDLRWIKTAVGVLRTLESVQRTKVKLHKVESLSLGFISSLLITFCSIVGCSDMPYTGSGLATDTIDVEQYMMSPNGELVCLQNGIDSECLTLIPKNTEKTDSINGPIIHIYPERLVYIFHHKGKEIVRLEKAIDTTNIAETLTETKGDPSSQAGGQSGGAGAAGNGSNNNNNPDDTQQSNPPPPQQDPADDTQQSDPPQQQTDDQSGGTAGDGSEANNNGDDAPPPRTPPPQQTNNQPGGNSNPNTGNSNPNTGGDNSQDSTVSHQTPNAIYYDDDPVGKWYVTIYYPDNYKGPHTTTDYGFTISSSNGEIVENEKTLTHNGVRFPITIGEGMLFVDVVWKTGPMYWEGDQPSRRYLIQARPGGTHRIHVTME